MRIPEQHSIYVRSMGKALRVTAIFLSDDAANRHMARTNDAVVCEIGPYIFLADKGDKGEAITAAGGCVSQVFPDPGYETSLRASNRAVD